MSTPAMRATISPCLCLCLGLSQITRTAPCRLTILQRSHIFFTEARTFISCPEVSLLESLDDPPPPGVGRGDLDLHPVPRKDAHRLEAGPARGVGQDPAARIH